MENQSETQSADKAVEGRNRGQTTTGGQETAFAESDSLYPASFGRSVGSQAAALRGLHSSQRQAVMRKISQIHGNQHVLRLLSSINSTPAMPHSAVQRQDHEDSTAPNCSQTDPMARAIDLFAASTTASTPRGAAVLVRLRELQPQGEIVYGELEGGEHGHTVDPGPPFNEFARLGRPDITVSDSHTGDVVATALTLVHEGNHHAQDATTIEEEMQSFELETLFYQELLAGIMMCGVRYQATAGDRTLRDWELSYEAYQHNQLVDHVCTLYSDSLTPEWIIAHLNDWGGLANRQDQTRGRYIQVLCRGASAALIWPQVLRILECFHTRSGYDSVVGSAGAIDEGTTALNVERGTAMIRDMFNHSYIRYGDPGDLQRLRAIEARHGVDLGGH